MKSEDTDAFVNEDKEEFLFNGNDSFHKEGVDYNNDLQALIEECDDLDGFERASALALFHGEKIDTFFKSFSASKFVVEKCIIATCIYFIFSKVMSI